MQRSGKTFCLLLGVLLVVLVFAFPGDTLSQIEYTAAEADMQWTGQYSGSQLGYSVAVGADIDEDGLDDVVLGAKEGGAKCYFGQDGSVSCDGSVVVARGDNGLVLFNIQGPSNLSATPNGFGSIVALGSFDGDDAADILVGAPNYDMNGEGSGRVFLYSGTNASTLQFFDCGGIPGERCGKSVVSRCDIDGDNFDDILVTSSLGLYVYSGDTFGRLASLSYDGVPMGESLACLGDLNGDGRDEFGVSSAVSQRVFVYEGGSFAKLGELSSDEFDSRFGSALSRLGDWDGDGFDDFAVGAAGFGEVDIYSADLSLITRIPNPEAGCSDCRFGETVSGLGDINLDGVPDLLVGDPSWRNSIGRAYVFSGATSNLLFTIKGESEQDDFSWACHSNPNGFDANGDDGIADFICTAWKSDFNGVDSGKGYLFYSPVVGPVPWPDEASPTPPSNDDESEEEINALLLEVAGLESLLGERDEEIALLKVSLSNAESLNAACLSAKAELEASNGDLRAQLDSVSAELATASKEMAELESKVFQLTVANTLLRIKVRFYKAIFDSFGSGWWKRFVRGSPSEKGKSRGNGKSRARR